MRVDDFKRDPTGANGPIGGNHPTYEGSIFTTVAPEYSTGEVLLGSAYRGLLLSRSEKAVNLDEIKGLPDTALSEMGGRELWQNLLLQPGGIASPMRGGQSKSGFLPQLMPIVPQIAYYACVLGRMRSRWSPYNLLMHVIAGGLGEREGPPFVEKLGNALKVEKNDDLLARILGQAFDAIVVPPLMPNYFSPNFEKNQVRTFRGRTTRIPPWSPAERFCKDLEALLPLKENLTRRQWTVLIEAELRIGLAMYILWVCHLNVVGWEKALSVIDGDSIPSEDEIERLFWMSHRDKFPLLEFGHDADILIKQMIERYVYARFGLNLLLYRLDDVGCPWTETIGHSPETGVTAPKTIRLFLEHLSLHRKKIGSGGDDGAKWLRRECVDLLDEKASLVKCTDGFTRNILEFIRYSLGQLETKNLEQRSYDQSYLLASIPGKNRHRPNWVVRPGPAMLISLVHACCYTQGGVPTSIEDFRAHLADYGLHVPAGELIKGQVGADLEKLGLVVDSPDAAGGRLLANPF
jgi:hypothetical protein